MQVLKTTPSFPQEMKANRHLKVAVLPFYEKQMSECRGEYEGKHPLMMILNYGRKEERVASVEICRVV